MSAADVRILRVRLAAPDNLPHARAQGYVALRGGPESRDPSPATSLGRAFSAGANVLQRAGSASGSAVGINKSGRRPGPNDARAPQRPAGMPTPQMAPGQVRMNSPVWWCRQVCIRAG